MTWVGLILPGVAGILVDGYQTQCVQVWEHSSLKPLWLNLLWLSAVQLDPVAEDTLHGASVKVTERRVWPV